MATRSRIGYVLSDDSIVSVYHHWDGYPEWLGVTLKQQYNTEEKVKELIDGGNMSCCYSDNEFDFDKQEYVKKDPSPSYYGGDSEAPKLFPNLTELSRVNDGSEYLYLFLKGRWECYSIDQHYDDNYNIVNTTIQNLQIPDDYPADIAA